MNPNDENIDTAPETELYECSGCEAIVSVEDTFCPNCGAEITDAGNDFAENADAQAKSEAYVCSDCGANVSFNDALCPICSAALSEIDESYEDELSATVIGNEHNIQNHNPTVKTVDDGKSRITVGVIIAIIGIAVLIVSPSLMFSNYTPGDLFRPGDGLGGTTQYIDLRSFSLFVGAAFLIIGGIIAALGFSKSNSGKTEPTPTPLTHYVGSQSVAPKSVTLGNTIDEVLVAFGQPEKIVDLGARVIHVYIDMKIIYDNGKVSDVQLS